MMESQSPKAAPPFSRPFRVDDARDQTVDIEITANEAERAALAQEAGIPAIAHFTAKLQIVPGRRGRVEVTGEIRARVTQVCVVTLDPFETDLKEDVEATFAPQEDAERAAARFAARPEAETPDADAAEPPDPIIDGRIDLGQLAMEFFVLGLDPYPRAPGVAFQPELGRTPEPPEESPFAALARLRKPDADQG